VHVLFPHFLQLKHSSFESPQIYIPQQHGLFCLIKNQLAIVKWNVTTALEEVSIFCNTSPSYFLGENFLKTTILVSAISLVSSAAFAQGKKATKPAKTEEASAQATVQTKPASGGPLAKNHLHLES